MTRQVVVADRLCYIVVLPTTQTKIISKCVGFFFLLLFLYAFLVGYKFIIDGDLCRLDFKINRTQLIIRERWHTISFDGISVCCQKHVCLAFDMGSFAFLVR